MKTVAQASPSKRPVNLLLSENNVQQARHARQQLGDAVADAWNRFHMEHGAFADEHSTL